MRLAEKTQMSAWTHGDEVDEAECESCDWDHGRDKQRIVEYAARRHVDETGHVITIWRTWSHLVFLADDEPAR